MRQTAICAFDIGVSLDINDDIFKSCADRMVEKDIFSLDGVRVQHPSKELPYGVHLSIGAGLGIDLTDTDIKGKWKEKAYGYVYEKSFFKYSPNCDDKLDRLFGAISIDNIYMTVYSIGVAYLSIEINSIDEKEYHDCVIDFYRCFEYAAYHHISEDIKGVIIDLLKYLNPDGTAKENEKTISLFNVSKRFDIKEIKGADLLPGFTCINIFLNEKCHPKVLKASQEYETPNSYDYIKMDNANVYFGWASSILETTTDNFDRFDRTLLIFEIVWVFQVISEAYENLFTLKAIDVLKNRTNESDIYTVDEINFLKNITNIIIQLTTYSSVTIDICEIKFMNSFESIAKITEKHSRLKSISETFLSIQNELAAEDSKKKEGILNKFVLVITSLTFISVTTDIIGTLNFDNMFMTDRMLRTVVLITSLVIGFSFFGIILFIYKRQGFKNLIRSVLNFPILLEEVFEKIATTKAKQEQVNSIAKQVIPSEPSKKLLVVGSGTGSLLHALHILNKKAGLYGIEVSEARHNLAKRKLDKTNVNLCNCSIKKSGFKDRVFDIIVYSGSFKWWDGTTDAFDEVFRLLKAGGTAYFYTLDKECDESRINATISETKFKENFIIEKIESGSLQAWFKATLNKPDYKAEAKKAADEAKEFLSQRRFQDAADKCSKSILCSLRAMVIKYGYDADNYADMNTCLYDLIEQKKISSKYLNTLNFSMGFTSAVFETKNAYIMETDTKELYETAAELSGSKVETHNTTKA